MKYIIAGKSDTYWDYKKNTSQLSCRADKTTINKIKEEDTIVLLSGWWARSWSKELIVEAKKAYPTIHFEYLDGKFGEKERESLISDTILGRFDILDL